MAIARRKPASFRLQLYLTCLGIGASNIMPKIARILQIVHCADLEFIHTDETEQCKGGTPKAGLHLSLNQYGLGMGG